MGNLIDGRAIAEKVYVDLRREIADLRSKGVTPGVAVVLVGDNPASRTYVRSKDQDEPRARFAFGQTRTASFDYAERIARACPKN